MLSQTEGLGAAPATVGSTSPTLVRLLRKRLRQLLRVTLVLAIGLALAAGAFAIWWLRSLNGLPDIGDPFDVEAFRVFRIPDEVNAFTFLRHANEKSVPMPGLRLGVTPSDSTFSWSLADPKSREWAHANREALELFQQGAEQLDAAHPAGDPSPNVNASRMSYVALLEASRRQESGDMAGAWVCYRAVQRMIIHIRRRGSLDQRESIKTESGWLQHRLSTRAADPRTTIPQLHVTLQDAIENEPKPDWDSVTLKFGDLEMMRALERPIENNRQSLTPGRRHGRLRVSGSRAI